MTWHTVRLGDVCITTQGVQIPKAETTDTIYKGGYRYLYIADFIRDHNLCFVDNVYDNKKVTENDLVMANTGSPGRVFKGKDGILSNNLFKITFDNTVLNRDYLYLMLSSHYFQSILQQQMKGGIQKHLGHQTISRQEIPLPPLPEQKRIAAILDKADEIRRKREAALAKLDQLAQSIFVEMFGDVAINDKGWDIRQLEDLATKITDGEHQTPRRTSSGIKLLSARNVQNGYLCFNDVDYIDEEEYKKISKRCNPERNDILISCSGSIGRVSIVNTNDRLALVRSVALIKPNSSQVKSKYLEGILRTPFMFAAMIKKAHSSSQANLFQGPIRTLQIAVPPIPLQEEFVDRIYKLEKLKETNITALTKQNQLFATLQHQAFNGKF